MKTATVRIDKTAPGTTSNADAEWHKDSFTLTLTASDSHTPVAATRTRLLVGGGRHQLPT